MASESTGKALATSSTGLRHRMHFLAGKAQSKPTEINTEPLTWQSGDHVDDAACEEDSGDESDAVGDGNEQNVEGSFERPEAPSRPPRTRTTSSSELPVSSAWYEDMALLPVFVSGLGTWLTGGDLLKNLLLVIFLIYYLHQIKEMPWVLYHSARPRQPSTSYPQTETSERFQRVAESELYKLEIFFLLLTVVSPLLGALLLRYVSAVITGEEPLSWLSTGLFVLAAGLRPWSHLIQRLTQRIEDLHDVIHYPNLPPTLNPDSSLAAETSELRKELEEMKHKLEEFERSLVKVKHKLATSVDKVYDYVDENVDPLSKSLKTLDKKMEQKVRQVEDLADKMSKGKSKEQPSVLIDTSASRSERVQFIWPLKYILPSWLLPTTTYRGSPTTKFSPMSRHGSLRYPSSSSERLETIPEESHLQYNKHPVGESVYRRGLVSRLVHRLIRILTFPFRLILRVFLALLS